MKIQSYSQLKKELRLGRELTIVEAKFGHKYLQVKRKIDKVQTNGVRFEGGSWLGLGMFGEKASSYGFLDNGNFILKVNDREFIVYRFDN